MSVYRVPPRPIQVRASTKYLITARRTGPLKAVLILYGQGSSTPTEVRDTNAVSLVSPSVMSTRQTPVAHRSLRAASSHGAQAQEPMSCATGLVLQTHIEILAVHASWVLQLQLRHLQVREYSKSLIRGLPTGVQQAAHTLYEGRSLQSTAELDTNAEAMGIPPVMNSGPQVIEFSTLRAVESPHN